jgi:hypothetical protein
VDEYTGEKEKTQKVIAKTATLVSKVHSLTHPLNLFVCLFVHFVLLDNSF